MSLIKYQHIYTFKDNLTTIDLLNDLTEFKNYLYSTSNYYKPPFTNLFIDISYIKFDNSFNSNYDVLDLSENSIFRVKKINFNKKNFKYIQVNFGRYITINNFKIYNYLDNEIPFILWNKSSSTSNYDTYYDVSFSANLSNVENVVLEIYPDAIYKTNTTTTTTNTTYQIFPDNNTDGTFNYDSNGNRTLTTTTVTNIVETNYVETKTTITTDTSIEITNIDGSISTTVNPTVTVGPVITNINLDIVNDFIYKISYTPLLTNTITDKIIYSNPSSILLNYYLLDNDYTSYTSPTTYRRGLLTSGIGFYGDFNDYYYTLDQFNSHLHNNVIFKFDNKLFDVFSINTTNISNNYTITFSYRVTSNSGSPNDVHIDINSLLFTTLNIQESSFQQSDLSYIIVDNLTVRTLYIRNNENITVNFTYSPYKKATLGYNNYSLNDEYKIIGETELIVDESVFDISNTSNVKFTENLISYNNNNIIEYENNDIKLSCNYLYLTNIVSDQLYSNNIVAKNNYINTLTCKNNITNNLINTNNTNITTLNALYINTNNIVSNNLISYITEISGNLNTIYKSNLNIDYPNLTITDDLSKNIIKIYDEPFIDYNSNIYIRKNIYFNEISCNNINCNSINYNINNIDTDNLSIDNKSIFKNNVYINNNNKPSMLIENTGKLKLAYYGNNETYGGYRMEILSYKVNEYNAGWAIKMLGKNNLYCKKDAYIRMIPSISNIMQDICGNPFKNPISVFEIDSDYLKHSSNQTPTQYSDDRVKHNEIDISNGLNVINKLKPLKYNKSNSINDSTTYFVESGYVAQDVKKINELSHLVFNTNINNLNKLSINYTGIQPFITKSIQELINEVENIQNRLDNLNI